MEDNNNNSFEIKEDLVNRQVSIWRQREMREVGDCLCVAGICTIIMAVIVSCLNYFLRDMGTGLGQLLWVAHPFIIWLICLYRIKTRYIPTFNIIHDMVRKVFLAFGIFAIGFFLFAMLFNFVESKMEGLEVYTRVIIKPYRVVLLLMGMALTITGYLLQHKWIVMSGIVCGLGGFFWVSLQFSSYLLSLLYLRTSDSSYYINEIVSCIVISGFAFFCLIMPGRAVKHHEINE